MDEVYDFNKTLEEMEKNQKKIEESARLKDNILMGFLMVSSLGAMSTFYLPTNIGMVVGMTSLYLPFFGMVITR